MNHIADKKKLYYYLARNYKNKEVSHLMCRTDPISFLDRIRFARLLDLSLEDITKPEFDTYVEFGFKVTY